MAGTPLGTRLFTWLKGELVGQDQDGNKFYRTKGGSEVHKNSLRSERRWVIYNGEPEASRVSADWHAWIHHTTDELPPEGGYAKHDWQQEHQPNKTGTAEAYRPQGSMLKAGDRPRVSSDYDAWQPE
ncbi:NADH:ubiquinone oxidoreductase subunit NDUFA12 [Kiloniella majae]|uniref:NADH:ubiquinone oxidoreductase subunit NDUFA12 n=1 Tax=Kiloniella majae TaxID=1938558 RepID=UPI000A2787D0|nr:NADH:ubiquinone oxidoreductase subunit NDUFA12 [Kiloniella majae]